MAAKIEPFKRIKNLSDAKWLKQRQLGIGGSDAAAVIGMNPWKTSDQLWEEKTGLSEPADISDVEAVKYGIKAEASLRQLFRLDFPEYKVYYRKNEILQSNALPWMQASLDGELTDSAGRKGVLEIKTTNILQSMQREKWNDRVPDAYFVQLLHYMLTTGYEFAILKAQLKSIWQKEVRITVRHYHFERADHEDDLRFLLKAEMRFWELIKSKERPPLALPRI